MPTDARFCSRCGRALPFVQEVAEPVTPPVSTVAAAPVATPVATSAPRPIRERRSYVPFLIAPFVIVVLALIIFKVLSGFPRDKKRETRVTETQTSTTVRDRAEVREETTTVEPDLVGRAPGTSTVVTAPPPQIIEQKPAPPPLQNRGDSGLSESQAVERVTRYIASTRYYGDDGECVKAQSVGYSNRGYTIEVYGAGCSGHSDGLMDRWRVDSENGDVFKQARDGRYLRP